MAMATSMKHHKGNYHELKIQKLPMRNDFPLRRLVEITTNTIIRRHCNKCAHIEHPFRKKQCDQRGIKGRSFSSQEIGTTKKTIITSFKHSYVK